MRTVHWSIVALSLLLSGCTVGLLYTHTFEPLTVNQHSAPVVANSAQGDIKHVQVGWIGVMWDRNGLGDIAREHGLQELYYADLEYLSVFTIWRQYTIHLYGR